MSKLQHTPGPWKIIDHEEFSCFNILSGPKLNHDGRNVFCIYATNITEEMRTQQMADVRLIAAAPEMLIELLKSIAELDKTGFASITSETIIMKATGWSYDILDDVLTKLSTGLKIEEVLSE